MPSSRTQQWNPNKRNARQTITTCCLAACGLVFAWSNSLAAGDYTKLPIADAHVHYSHDSVELTPPERVIEIMKSANLKFALVSSSDDNGTQLLSSLAPDLIIPGLRPYRRRGETGTWFTDDAALAYVEDLLSKNRYATIGEFHLYGEDADLPIPARLVKLADKHNLVLHAHSDAEAVTRLLAQSETVKVLWAHSGFVGPDEVREMLQQHDRLWADLAFRGEVGSGGELSQDWIDLFVDFPDRMMLGTDTYTPERIYYIPEHANGARVWLESLPYELAERVAWKNAHDLLMPVWRSNKDVASAGCSDDIDPANTIKGEQFTASITIAEDIAVSRAFSAIVDICSNRAETVEITVDATMPKHGHGMNYTPEVTLIDSGNGLTRYRVEGIVLHMPGQWQWAVNINAADHRETLHQTIQLN